LAMAAKGEPPPAALAVLGSGAGRGFAGIRHDGALVACGRGAVEGEVAVLSRIEVDPAMRRRGLARRIVTGLAGWAAERGATTGCVQVLADNTAALALYERLGFTVHHHYVNLRA
ncbi:MAG: GNAT family N-acetyltransferase, partial [Stackebrandtia sp.]